MPSGCWSTLPALPQPDPRQGAPKLSVLISSAQEAMLCEYQDIDVYYQLPMGLSGELSAMIELFQANPMLKPWFPAILIGEDYQAARVFLETIQPKLSITNNSGVGMIAKELRKITGNIKNANCLVIFINQIRMKIGVMFGLSSH